ncbi:hypothetical protein M8C21_033899 [Ambrosia artemisiifolia]|uniref:Uncharacterized protein n=1 Tax=Ambrosia artemisiifolia TaxID=4212 RepID=A0AAD5CVT8_AMBAR|nr:hypothetical protein M8C21_033899 [Ambrosia artemisiifolia]
MLFSEMSVVYMGCALEDDLEMKEGVVVQLKDDRREGRNNFMIENVGINGFDLDTELDFWPIQHPTEPSYEDRPVQCPMPHSSRLIKDERMQDDRFSDQKKSKAKKVLHRDFKALEATEPALKMVRKRHHDHTNTIMPLLPTSSVYPYLHQQPIFSNLQQVPKFES